MCKKTENIAYFLKTTHYKLQEVLRFTSGYFFWSELMNEKWKCDVHILKGVTISRTYSLVAVQVEAKCDSQSEKTLVVVLCLLRNSQQK